MKQVIDLLPAIAFLSVYFYTKDMIFSTYILLGSSIVQIATVWLIWRRVEKLHVATFFVLLLMGGLTIGLNDKRFIMWKPTIVNWLFAVLLIGSQFIGQKNLLQRGVEAIFSKMPEMSMSVPMQSWRNVNFLCALFFVFLGCINIYVAYEFDEQTWVTFKVVGLSILNLIGMIALFLYLSRFIQTEKPANDENSPTE